MHYVLGVDNEQLKYTTFGGLPVKPGVKVGGKLGTHVNVVPRFLNPGFGIGESLIPGSCHDYRDSGIIEIPPQS